MVRPSQTGRLRRANIHSPAATSELTPMRILRSGRRKMMLLLWRHSDADLSWPNRLRDGMPSR